MSGGAVRYPELSNVQVLKPFANFETKYQGQPVSTPIAVPGDLDSNAGKPGYDPNLIAGASVPIGAKAYIWLPQFFPQQYGVATPNYQYSICWRLRAQSEQTLTRAGNFGQRLLGVPQEPGNPDQSGPRYVIPAAFESIEFPYSQNTVVRNPYDANPLNTTPVATQVGARNTEDAANSPTLLEPTNVAVTSKRVGTFVGSGSLERAYQAPFTSTFSGTKAGHAGILSQGFYPDQNGTGNPSFLNAGYPGGPQFVLYETVVKGNEMILLLTRPTEVDGADEPDWDFAGVDRIVSVYLGTDNGTRESFSNVGIYLLTGSPV